MQQEPQEQKGVPAAVAVWRRSPHEVRLGEHDDVQVGLRRQARGAERQPLLPGGGRGVVPGGGPLVRQDPQLAVPLLPGDRDEGGLGNLYGDLGQLAGSIPGV